jgi:hypothetical protein
MKGAAELATSFIIKGLTSVIGAAESVVGAVQAVMFAIQDIASGNALNRVALAFGIIKEKALEAARAIASGAGREKLTKQIEATRNANALLAGDIVSNEAKQAKAIGKTAALFDKLRKSAQEVKKAINAPADPTGASALKAAIDARNKDKEARSKSLIDMKEMEKFAGKAAEKEKKKKTEAEKWKEKIKKANMELAKAKKLQSDLLRQAQQLQAKTTFGGALGALSDIASRANDKNLSAFQRIEQSELLDLGKKKFQQFDPNKAGTKAQNIEITITADEKGIITPVITSKEFEGKVTTITKNVVDKQARTNSQ